MKKSTYWDKRALRRLTEAEKNSEAYINRVKAIYAQAQKDINKQLESIYRNYSNETGLDTQKLKELLTRSETKETWEQMKRQGLDKYIKDNYKSRISRLEQIQAQVYARAKQIYPKEELANQMCYKGVIHNSYYKTMFDTQRGTGYDFNFSTIDNNMVKALLKDPWSGKNYSQRIWGNTDILANSLSEVLGGAMLSGQSMELTAKQIRDRFNVGKYYAERLIRTETNHFNNEADAMAFEELGLKKYVFVATLDSRTSEICQFMDNKVFEFDKREEGVNFPPLHPNCRSKTRAYLGQEEEKNLQRRARNPETGQTELIDNISYSQWIKKYNKSAEKYHSSNKIVTSNTNNISVNKQVDVSNMLNTYKGQDQFIINALNNAKLDTTGVKIINNIHKLPNVQVILNKKESYFQPVSNELHLKSLQNNGSFYHEFGHSIDYLTSYKSAVDKNNFNWYSQSLETVRKAEVVRLKHSLPDDLANLFDNEKNRIRATIKSDYINNGKLDVMVKDTINKKYGSNYYNASGYMKAYIEKDVRKRELIKITKKVTSLDEEYNKWSSLSDIYDAIMSGNGYNSDKLLASHGYSYYHKNINISLTTSGNVNKENAEIFANFVEMKLGGYDKQLKYLKDNSPDLFDELTKIYNNIGNQLEVMK